MMTALYVGRVMRESGHPLSELMRGFERYPQVLVNVAVRQNTPFADLSRVQEVVNQVEKRLSQNGRFLLRYSGTEPLARIMIEGERQGEIETYAENIAIALRQSIGA